MTPLEVASDTDSSDDWGTLYSLYQPDAWGDGFGRYLANVGDVDGDGCQDLIVSNLSESEGQRWWQSANLLCPGSRGPPWDTSDISILEGAAQSWDFREMRYLGDVNGDGFSDVVTEQISGTPVPDDSHQVQGLHVRYGGVGGLSSELDLEILLRPDRSRFLNPSWLKYASVGDVNGDGYDDLCVFLPNMSKPGEDWYQMSRILLFYGSKSGLETVAGYNRTLNARVEAYGESIGYIRHGDINDDGYEDIIIHATRYPGPYWLYYYLGSEEGIANEPDGSLIVEFDDIHHVSSELHPPMDVNGDGIDDVIVEMMRFERMHIGQEEYIEYHPELHVYFGSKNGPRERLNWFVQLINWNVCTSERRRYARTMDLNSDGYSDYITYHSEASGYDLNPDGSRLTYVKLFIDVWLSDRGSLSGPTWSFKTSRIPGFTTSLPEVVDFDGDGIPDLSVGIVGRRYLTRGQGSDYSIDTPGSGVLIINGSELLERCAYVRFQEGPRVYAGLRAYDFWVRAGPRDSSTFPEELRLILDQGRANVILSWNLDQLPREESDPEDYVRFMSRPGDIEDDPVGSGCWYIFKIYFNWTWPHEDPCDVVLETIGIDGAMRSHRVKSLFSVENDLEMVGELIAEGEHQGRLAQGDWVRACELVTLSGPMVVYEGTRNLHPPAGVCEVVVFDNDGEYVKSPSPSEERISLSIRSDERTDINETLTLSLQDLPGAAKAINPQVFELKVDGDSPKFWNAIPDGDDWMGTNRVMVAITADDTGTSGVNASSLEYSYSVRGTIGYGLWTRAYLLTTPSGPTIDALSHLDLPDGDDYYIRWRVKDLAGNGYALSDHLRIRVDTQNVSFTDPIPAEGEWQNETLVECGVTITDLEGSGIDVSTVQYRVSHRNLTNYGGWTAWTGQLTDSRVVEARVNAQFGEGPLNHIQWRAMDLAGNGYTASPHYRVQVDTAPLSFHDFAPLEVQASADVNSSIMVDDTPTGSGIDLSRVFYRYRTGARGYGQWIPAVIQLASLLESDGPNPIVVILHWKGTAVANLTGLEDGWANLIQFKAFDKAGNGPSLSQEFRIGVDTKGPKFLEIQPEEGVVQPWPEVAVTVTIADHMSGLDRERVKYKYGTSGESSVGAWNGLPVFEVEGGFQGTVAIALARGRSNFVQFRCFDLVGNGNVSEAVNIWVNMLPVGNIHSPRRGSTLFLDRPLTLSGEGSVDPDGDDLEFMWYIDGESTPIAQGKEEEVRLSKGSHTIVLVVSDPYGAEDRVSVEVDVREPRVELPWSNSWLVLILLVIIVVSIVLGWLYLRVHQDEPIPGDDRLQ